ncbi:MAG: bifunctional aspartate kinase/homoserine dehydrogenase I [Planctomycetes bacterium]|nr:bifunctional aspartate kinase/homoserine dehydrogenase I [Planctomycetota bacterium]
MGWHIHKFGGTSLFDSERIANAGRLLVSAHETQGTRIAVVVSAMGGVTNELIRLAETASQHGNDYPKALEKLQERITQVCSELLEDPKGVIEFVRHQIGNLREILRGVELAGTCPPSTLDLVSGHGEVWSSAMLQAWLTEKGLDAVWLDAREVLVVQQENTGPSVCWEETERNFARWMDSFAGEFLVITGFVARDPSGTITTLRRNGSDFSASIFGKLLKAESITIWTDVDGVLSADPRQVPEAITVEELTYSEAIELAFFGAKVLHPQTMGPAVELGIPILIRNSQNVEARGTWIRAQTKGERSFDLKSAVKGISSIDNIALLNLEGSGMIGVPGIASRLFTALHQVGVSVTMISQASSEHSICVAIPFDRRHEACAAVEAAFVLELAHGQVQSIDVSGPFSILAVVGDDMVETSGVAAKLFSTLGRSGINVRAIAQGSSERNISAVVDQEQAARALRSTHAGFYLADRTISVGLIGPGLVGAELLHQLKTQEESLHRTQHIDLRVRGITNSTRMLLDDQGIPVERWREPFERQSRDANMELFADHIQAGHLPHSVILDCSASPRVAEHYASWLERGIHVITPNKLANTDRLEKYRRLRELGDRVSARYLYEATVGAGLPVISTLRELIRTGDRVRRIEGVLSGTLSYLLGRFTGREPFSAIVAEAERRGFMEPDPRDDLSGLDVARKAVILGREFGLDLELEHVPVDTLVPEALADCDDAKRFLAGLPKFDDEKEMLRQTAEKGGKLLRYGAVIEADGRVEVGLRQVLPDHPFATIRPGDNIIAFTTDRYSEDPLIVQGPGAGPEVTAAGVFGDLLRLASSLGEPL